MTINWKGGVWVLVLTLAAGSCASRRPGLETVTTRVEERLPGAWSGGDDRDRPLTSHFLHLIDDDRLRALLSEAWTANNDLLASARRLEAAARSLVETRAPRWPELAAELQRSRTNRTFDRGVATAWRVGLVGSWDVDLWGRLARLNDQNRAEVASLVFDFAAARDALGARVIQSWVAVVSVRQAIGIEQTRVSVLEQLQETIRRRYLAGIGNLDDLAAARTATDLARMNVVALEMELGEARRTLELLLGRPPRAAVAAPLDWPAIEPVETGDPLAVIWVRNDVAAAMHRLEAADAAAAAAVRARLPSLRFSAEGGPRGGASLGDIVSGKPAWTLLTGITGPIFQRGLLRARSEARRLEFEAASEEVLGIVWRAVAEIENALAREHAMLRQRELLTSAAVEAARNTGVQEDRYRLGLVSVVELLTVRNQELDIQRQVVAMRGEVLSNRIALALAIGASFAEPAT